MERLKGWRRGGKWKEWDLPVSFYGKFARGLSRISDGESAREVYAEALRISPPSDNTWPVLLDYAEFLRKAGETTASRALLDKALPEAPPAFRNEVAFLRARVDWKAGRTGEARETFLAIAEEGGVRPGTAEKARYLAAWIAWEEGDISAATDAFGKLRAAKDNTIRQEATFRNAFGLYLLKRYSEAVALFEEGGRTDFSSVERARHAYWKAVAIAESAGGAGTEGAFIPISVDPGGKPYAMLEAPSTGETASCGHEQEKLWELVLNAEWGEGDLGRIRRAERLVRLGIPEYAALEAGGVGRAAIRKAIGLAEGGTSGLIRYLAGDLRGAIRDTTDVPNDPATVELIDRIQYPLAPDLVGDCDRKKSGVDPLVLHAVIRQESHFQHNVLSPAGALGLMQMLPGTAVEVARKERMRKPGRKDLLNPKVNVTLGAAYLSHLLKVYGGDYLRAVAAYNAGEVAVAKWWEKANGDPALFLESVTYRETRFYVRRVFLNVLQYYQIYRPKMFSSYFPSAPKEAPQPPGAPSTPPGAGTPGAPAEPKAGPGNGRSSE
jgi:soluble lytic murein transglycosylase-like protein